MLSEDVGLFAALRPELTSDMLQVTWGRPDEALAAMSQIAPWPWALCSEGPDLLAAAAALASQPILWFWLGSPPPGAPSHTRVHRGWRDLALDVAGCLQQTIAGVRLAPNRGLLGPGSELILSVELEGFLGSAPLAMKVGSRSVASARRVLAREDLPLALHRVDDGFRLEGL